jgi:hypothetical protein
MIEQKFVMSEISWLLNQEIVRKKSRRRVIFRSKNKYLTYFDGRIQRWCVRNMCFRNKVFDERFRRIFCITDKRDLRKYWKSEKIFDVIPVYFDEESMIYKIERSAKVTLFQSILMESVTKFKFFDEDDWLNLMFD